MTRRIFCKVLLVVVAIFGLLVLSGVLSAQGRSEDAFERVREVQERHTDRLMAKEGVVGTAIGFNQNDQLAVKVFTARPGVGGIAKKLDGVPVQVVVTGKIYALTTGRYDRPVPTGVSTGHPDITAGTIACRVKDSAGNVYALSNNHVYANSNEASIGDTVIQPGTFDGGSSPVDDIGTLADFEPIVFSRRARNEIDAAIALTTTDMVGNGTPSDGYGTPNSTIVGAVLGQQVQKFGRTTELTTGEITAVNVTIKVGYGPGKTARFVKQIIVESGTRFIGGGDSGSLLVTNDTDCNPVGLLFAGNGSGTMAVANRIDLVLDRFDVTVDDEAAGPPPQPPTLSSISVTPTSASIQEGQTQQFTAIGSFDDGSTADLTSTATWASSNTAVATVDASGLATGIAAGTTDITATQDGVTSNAAALDVTPATTTDTVTITKAEYSSRRGQLKVEATYKDADGNPIAGATLVVVGADGTIYEPAMSYDSRKKVYKYDQKGKDDPGATVTVRDVVNLVESELFPVKHK